MNRTNELFKVNCKNRRKIDMKPKFIKVDSPIAKYDSLGNLSCVLCRIPIKSNIWKVHLNSKQHKQNVEHAKRQPTGIDNKSDISLNPRNSGVVPHKVECIQNLKNQLQADSCDQISQIVTPQVLPEKFFDHERSLTIGRDIDPETEWIKFQREIKEAATISNNIVSEEQDSLNIKRQLKEIDEQIENWKRFIKINDKKNALTKNKNRERKSYEFEVESSSSEECSVDNLLDWRIKSINNLTN